MRLRHLYQFEMRLNVAVVITASRVHQRLKSYPWLLNFCPAHFQSRAILVFPPLKNVDNYDKESSGNEMGINLRCEKWWEGREVGLSALQ